MQLGEHKSIFQKREQFTLLNGRAFVFVTVNSLSLSLYSVYRYTELAECDRKLWGPVQAYEGDVHGL